MAKGVERALALLPALLLTTLLSIGPARADGSEWRQAFRKAEAYYWMSVQLDGDRLSLDKAARALDRAANLAAEDRKPVVEALRRSIAIQKSMAAETFQGMFPLARLLAGAQPAVPLELYDPPEWRAAAIASRTMLERAAAAKRDRTPLSAVLSAPDDGRRLEAEAAARAHPDVLLHPRHVVIDKIGNDRKILDELDEGRPTAETLGRLGAALGAADLLAGTLHALALDDGDTMVEARGRLYRAASNGDVQIMARGFGRDRRALLAPILLWTLALGLVVVARGGFVLKRTEHIVLKDCSREKWLVWVQSIALLAMAFLLGRVLPLVLFPALGHALPLPDAGVDVERVWWWPGYAGLLLFAAPLLVWRVLSARAAAVLRIALPHGRLGLYGAALALGAAAHAGGLLLRYRGIDALPAANALALGASTAGWLLGRCLDRFDALHPFYAAPALALMALLGEAACFAVPSAILATLLPTLGVLMLLYRSSRRMASAGADASAVIAMPDAQWANPVVEQARRALAACAAGAPCWLTLTGPTGAGKTTAINQLLESLRADGQPLTVLRGSCDPISGKTVAPTFGPFEQALKGHLHGSLAADRLDAALDATTSLLLSPVAPMLGGGAAEQNLHAFVCTRIEALAEEALVVLVIEDVQWLDEASRALLAFLRRNFRRHPSRRFAVVLEGRNDPAVDELVIALEITVHAVGLLERADQLALLASKRLTPKAAEWLVEWNSSDDSPQTPGALDAVIRHLLDCGRLVVRDEVIELNAAVTAVPVLGGMADGVLDTLKEAPAARSLLTAAACAAVNTRFDAALLATALGRPLSEVIEQLEDLAFRPRPLVRDDGCTYRFTSQHVLDAVRYVLRTQPCGPAEAMPLRVRFMYGCLARVLRERSRDSIVDVERLALYSYAAGPLHAEVALDALIDAAGVLMCSGSQFGKARELLSQAAEVAAAVPALRPRFERERLRLQLLESHLANDPQRAARAAREALPSLSDSAADPLLPPVLQACCDGMGRDPGLRGEAVRLATRLAESDAPGAMEGLHILALCQDARSPERCGLLRRALAAARERGDREAESRITNSLAEALSVSDDPATRDEARALFETSLALKEALPIPDRRGMARTLGGLGRLAFFGTPRDIPTARRRFLADLELSVELGDLRGQSQMNSLLGACALEEGDLDEAISRHQAVLALNVHPFDVFMSHAGLMRAHRARDGEAGFRAAHAAFEAAGGFAAAPEGTCAALRAATADPVGEPA